MRLSHVGWNLAGLGCPLVVAALVVPGLLDNLGPERFGILTLAWAVIGYSSVLDFGVGRAATNRLAALRSTADPGCANPMDIVTTALWLARWLGATGALVLVLATLAGATSFIRAAQVPNLEIAVSAIVLAAAIPMQVVSATYRGVNEACLNFRGISLVRLVMGAANFAVPFLASLSTRSLPWIFGTLVLARAAGLLLHGHLARRCLAAWGVTADGKVSRAVAKDLFGFGGWFALGNVLNSCGAVADRFLLAALVSAASASAYVIPYEIVVQCLFVVGAMTTVAFPYFTRLRTADTERMRPAFFKALGAATGTMFLISCAFWLLGANVLALWLGADHLAEHDRVMRTLSLGLAPYAAGTMCIALLHAHGKTKLTAKINLLEFPVYLLLLISMIDQLGTWGAALTWVLRVSVNAAIVCFFALRRLR